MLADDSIPSMGGKARAEALTAEQRADIAKKAAEARWSIPEETHSGQLNIAGIKILCHVLSDGTRLLSQEGMNRSLGRRGRPKARHEEDGGLQVPVFLQANNLQTYIPQEHMEVFKPIKFKRKLGGAYSVGYKAEILPKTCHVFLDAKEAGKLVPSQFATAERCKILSRGFSEVGIIALVDEATGYQEVRDRLALQKILERYVRDEWAKWTRRFSNEFYRHLFRLKNIPFPPSEGTRKPSYVGHWTNDIVYDRLTPGLKQKLREVNPRTLSGNRARKHHQHLTEDLGVPELQQHLSNVEFLMKTCQTWEEFKDRLDMAAPKIGDTMRLPLEITTETK